MPFQRPAVPSLTSEPIGVLGDFGDFCLMCGTMIDEPVGVDDNDHRLASAYCSEQCRLSDELESTASHRWSDSQASYSARLGPSYCSSPHEIPSAPPSSADTSLPESPSVSASDRLAILCSGPPVSKSPPPLELGERLLGAAAVARYLAQQTPQDDCPGEENDPSSPWVLPCQATASPENLASLGLSLKATPASVALSDLNTLAVFGQQSSPRKAPPGCSAATPTRHSPRRTCSFVCSPTDRIFPNASTNRRVSQPLPAKPCLDGEMGDSLNDSGNHPLTCSFKSQLSPSLSRHSSRPGGAENLEPNREAVHSPSTPETITLISTKPAVVCGHPMAHQGYAFYL